jgi:hypothetical protein
MAAKAAGATDSSHGSEIDSGRAIRIAQDTLVSPVESEKPNRWSVIWLIIPPRSRQQNAHHAA